MFQNLVFAGVLCRGGLIWASVRSVGSAGRVGPVGSVGRVGQVHGGEPVCLGRCPLLRSFSPVSICSVNRVLGNSWLHGATLCVVVLGYRVWG